MGRVQDPFGNDCGISPPQIILEMVDVAGGESIGGIDFGTAPAEPLMLVDVIYDNVDFTREDDALAKIWDDIEERLRIMETKERFLRLVGDFQSNRGKPRK